MNDDDDILLHERIKEEQRWAKQLLVREILLRVLYATPTCAFLVAALVTGGFAHWLLCALCTIGVAMYLGATYEERERYSLTRLYKRAYAPRDKHGRLTPWL